MSKLILFYLDQGWQGYLIKYSSVKCFPLLNATLCMWNKTHYISASLNLEIVNRETVNLREYIQVWQCAIHDLDGADIDSWQCEYIFINNLETHDKYSLWYTVYSISDPDGQLMNIILLLYNNCAE